MPNHKVSYAIFSILGGHGASGAFAAEPNVAPDAIAEIIVTAQRRDESIQDVPITVQVLTGETLSQLNATTVEDFVKYLPNVTTGTIGPGQGNLYMRGLSVGPDATQGSGSTGQFPNVAVYLDDQSASLPSRNLDVYAADMERIEILEGPQGTLFGAGAEAGVVRYITKKPKVNVTEGQVSASYGTTAHGENNSSVQAIINLPLIADHLALRAVVYDDERGGYIDNLPSQFTRLPTDLGLANNNGGVVPNDSVAINNNNLAGDAINPLTYKGLRVSALSQFNDGWNALLTQSYQQMGAQGVYYQQPTGSQGQALPPLSVTQFNPSSVKDEFRNTALTISGEIAGLRMVYSGAYLVRNIEQVQDYTDYARGAFGYYYQCVGYSTDPATGKCYTPSSVWKDKQRNTNHSEELRFTTATDHRLRGLFGLFYQNLQIQDSAQWLYRSVPNCSATQDTNCFHPVQPFPGQPVFNPSAFNNSSLGFSNDYTRAYSQKAFFTSIDFDIIPNLLTVTAGTRYSDINNSQEGGNHGVSYCKEFTTPTTNFGPCPTNVQFGNPLTAHNKAQNWKSRANLSYKPMQDVLLYATWSQGFRVAGFNRSIAAVAQDANGIPQFIYPIGFKSDTLTNKEIGFKTEWFNNRLQWNGTYYREDWKDVPLEVFSPENGLGNLGFTTSGPSFVVKGFEMQIVARPGGGVTIHGSAAWNGSRQVNDPGLANNNCSGGVQGGVPFPPSPTCGGQIPLATPIFTAVGSPLAQSPRFQMNLRARYEVQVGDYRTFYQFGGIHQSLSYGQLAAQPLVMPTRTTYDAAIGIGKDAWGMQLFGQNITNVNASLLTAQEPGALLTQTPTRPRVLGLQFHYDFSDVSK